MSRVKGRKARDLKGRPLTIKEFLIESGGLPWDANQAAAYLDFWSNGVVGKFPAGLESMERLKGPTFWEAIGVHGLENFLKLFAGHADELAKGDATFLRHLADALEMRFFPQDEPLRLMASFLREEMARGRVPTFLEVSKHLAKEGCTTDRRTILRYASYLEVRLAKGRRGAPKKNNVRIN